MKSSIMRKKQILLFVGLFFSIFLTTTGLNAAEFHVATTGDDMNGDGTMGNPWRHPEYGAKQLSPGDTLLIHAGTYSLSTANLPDGQTTMNRGRGLVSPPYNVDGTSGNPFTIKSYEDDFVLLDAGASPSWPAVGSNYGNYIYVDGISVRGCAVFMWCDYGKITNCDLSGGIDCPVSNGGDNFGCVLRVEGGTGTIVENNKLHDNQIGISQKNSPLLMEYDSTNLLIKNNEIYNSVGYGIHLKDDPESVTVSYNFIHDNTYSGVNSANQDEGHNIAIHNNILLNNNHSGDGTYGAISITVHAAHWKIYNNTFINNHIADIRSTGTTNIEDIQVWNNIMYRSNDYYYQVGWSSTGATFSGQWTYSDYNCFYGGQPWKERSTTFNSLSTYQSGNGQGFDSNSNILNPNFVNVNGTNPEDFKRTSYPENGRGGNYSSVMGAYVNGDEVIGINTQTTIEEPLAPPESLRIL